ncbi:DNA polymerase III subunit alpha [Sulfobacillus harzensis]|uniref:DNA-directed DNA polymerase n=1 Tax=Sulfobacillus harzensis TaxID=2729629 RepID=A0A7Y0L5E0_9FIRM|nr:DNA polymerase III subunit alpha [Sulfobacillus harzensis]NMP23036.1 DNA polymerase III subunit alpha [Sulfobacillus harzensis]
MSGAHLHVHSAFSFLNGASHPTDIVREAASQGITTLALTDDYRVSGIVPFLKACQEYGVKGIVGAEVEVEDWGKLVLLVPESSAYPDLTALLTAAHLENPRGQTRVNGDMLRRYSGSLIALTGDREGLLARAYIERDMARLAEIRKQLAAIFGPDRLYVEVTTSLLPGDRRLFRALRDLAEAEGWPLVATGAVHYARKESFGLYDLMTCIRTGERIESVFSDRRLNAENYLKPWSDFEKLFRDWPQVLAATEALAERLQSPELFNRRFRPLFALPEGMRAEQALREKVLQGSRRRYKSQALEVRPRIERELSVIQDLGFSDYFLVVADVADFARQQGIRFSGRGSAADSVVAYCLGITDVDAWRRNLLFERFMSRERQEMPDIDIDFDARRRDEVEAYVTHRYGSEHVARVATYQTYRQRLAVREIGKVMGFPPQELDALAKSLPEAPIHSLLERWEQIPELRQYPESDRLRAVLTWAKAIEGLPRHIGTHLGGVVITDVPIEAISPRERSPKGVEIVQFDKRDVEDLGLMKLDLLSLRTFSAVEVASQAIQQRQAFDYDQIPLEDEATFQRLQKGDSIGVFQLESPAQRALAQRLQPSLWEDIVASLALIRPGPIKGNMVDPFVARRRGEEPVTYLHPDLEPILSKTYGVVLFQEQVIAIASTLAGFTPGEADLLRRVMTHARSTAEMEMLGQRFREKAMARGVSEEIADQVFQQIVGYASYGFNEAHAAAFAETSYRTAYLLEHFPRQYFLGLLNAEPLGYYPIDVLLVEARRRQIPILPMDINQSQAAASEEGSCLRIGLGFLNGMGMETAEAIVDRRPQGGYRHPEDVAERVPGARKHLPALIEVGAFDCISPDRSGFLEDIQGTNGLRLTSARSDRLWTPAEQVVADYRHLGFGQRWQWMEFWRPHVAREGYQSIQDIQQAPAGQPVRAVALFYRPHRPPTRSGRLVVFFSLVDETGVLEARLSSKGYQRFGHLLFGKVRRMIAVAGIREPSGIRVTALSAWPPEA